VRRAGRTRTRDAPTGHCSSVAIHFTLVAVQSLFLDTTLSFSSILRTSTQWAGVRFVTTAGYEGGRD
jgi:hypothetical protein